MKIEVFDPPMCCSTGVCGPSVDPELVRFASDLDWLRGQGVTVERYNLSQQTAAFVATPVVKTALENQGDGCLPLTLADGAAVCSGRYPTRQELAAFAGLAAIEARSGLFTDAVRELVAIGASIAANCEPCFRHHYAEARKLGVSKEDMSRAVETAQAVKEAVANAVSGLAAKYLQEAEARAVAPCCGPASGATVSIASRAGKGSSCC